MQIIHSEKNRIKNRQTLLLVMLLALDTKIVINNIQAQGHMLQVYIQSKFHPLSLFTKGDKEWRARQRGRTCPLEERSLSPLDHENWTDFKPKGRSLINGRLSGSLWLRKPAYDKNLAGMSEMMLEFERPAPKNRDKIPAIRGSSSPASSLRYPCICSHQTNLLLEKNRYYVNLEK